MDWLFTRLREPSTWVGIIGFVLTFVAQFWPAVKDAFGPDFVNAASSVLATVSGILIGKPAATPPVNPSA